MRVLKSKKLEQYSNIAVIVVAIIFIAWFAETRFAVHKAPAPVASPIGKKISLASVSLAPENVVLGLSTVCHFCQMNTGLYKRLAGMQERGKISVIAVIPQEESEAKEYLAKDGLETNLLAGRSLSDFYINGTPTILLVDSKGIVRKAWMGALNQPQQNKVVDAIKHGF